ncbi:uncharacterized protein (TIGR02594 family) [Novosphingobium sp. GV055]|uniref:TIGR02594 family protein n=2 Tax=Novosphingobium TaxID=165696 RepID=UPI000D302254|nr:TIGR02594 family protein [Novosphingobium sp. GV055]PTR07533.1 uncharacterized protein (TIGR02594 family) [Novosphingobium sp. GV055]PUB00235.1 uncharacterized protein (TIGR02594 family) [Novosphingobium sp. GV061]PUB15276.1 uncharacterized protein (TIGR02594 family) [Novosphingobium sp. GV079]PUB39152.1 uncharacterized protein (TIGR02594 family) [Novosphingobium sp. GV027]
MPTLPPAYGWLSALAQRPRMIDAALALYGVTEMPGAANNPQIIGWAKELGGTVAKVYTADSIAWCGLFMAVVADRAGKTVPANPLWALSWAQFGNPAPVPGLGDVLTFRRDGGGHVGLYVAEDEAAYHVLGGNQGDRVSIARIAKSRFYAARRPVYQVQPASVKPYRVAAQGQLSTNEA